jgi:hypothetical protein
MFIPVIPVIHRPHPRFSAWRDSENRCNDLPVAGSGHPETDRCSQARPSGDRRRFAEPKPKEARSGQPEGRSARRRRKPKPNPLSFEGPAGPEAPGRKVPRKDTKKLRFIGRPIGNRNSKPQGREGRNPPGNRRPAARQGSEPAGTGTGPAMVLRRNLRDRPGPQGLARNPPGKGGLAFGQDQRT